MGFVLRALQRSRPVIGGRVSAFRWITSTPDLHKPEGAAAAEPAAPEPEIPPRTPVGGARVQLSNPDDAIEVFVDGYPVKIPKGMTVLQACEVAGVDIPRFCYHSRLSIAGNCRMCLVEVEKSPKPVASCAMPALPGTGIILNLSFFVLIPLPNVHFRSKLDFETVFWGAFIFFFYRLNLEYLAANLNL